MISPTGNQTSDHRLQSWNSTTKQQFILHTSDTKLTSHINCAANWPQCVLLVTSVLFARALSPPGPCLPKRIWNTHLHNYYDLKGKDIDLHFSFLSRGIILWIEIPWPENLVNTYARHMETLDSCFKLIRSHQQCILWSPPLKIKN